MDIKTLKANYPLTLPIHKLLGSCTHQSNTEWTFSSDISTINVEFLSDYKILENIMFPGAGYIEIVASLGRFFYQNNSVLIENLFIHTPLTLYASEEVRMDTVCTLKSDHLEVNIFTERSNQNVLSRVLNVSCKVSQKKNEVTYMDSKLINKIKSINNIKVNLEEFYNNLSILKISYGKIYYVRFDCIETTNISAIDSIMNDFEKYNILNSFENDSLPIKMIQLNDGNVM